MWPLVLLIDYEFALVDDAIVGGEANDVDASWEDGVDGNWMWGWCAKIDGLT